MKRAALLFFIIFVAIAGRTIFFSEKRLFYINEENKMETLPVEIQLLVEQEARKGKKPNRLIFEKSPYLLQHAFNPVDWFAWGEEAFTKAREENKIIFLSIGYSTCYWCHVMEREIFENEEIARLINTCFIAIKVDREERPDLDRVYMNALVSLTGSGGWPMSLFLTPDLKPFYGATYLPPVPQYGRPSFPEVIEKISGVWKSSPEKVMESGDEILRHLKEGLVTGRSHENIDPGILKRAFEAYAGSYDPVHGGFEKKVKFPRPVSFNFLLQFYRESGNVKALDMVLGTLRNMGKGGIFDHVGGGFHRYSTDPLWRVPHFEKMLYDQAQLVLSYIDAYLITDERFFKEVAQKTLGYVLREMTAEEGGFYSAQDAESAEDPQKPDQKEEGRFYLWKSGEVKEVLGNSRGEIFCHYFGILEKGNAPEDPLGVFKGLNVLYIAHTASETAAEFGVGEEEVKDIIKRGLSTLYQVRVKRLPPSLDDKILLGWNGLMISAMARGYQVFRDEKYLRAAEAAAGFLTEKLYNRKERSLLRRYRRGDARYDAHLQDYAFFAQGLIDLYEASFNIRWLELAITLTETQNLLFYDSEKGGFFETTGEDPSVIYRMKDAYDGAEPTGNSVAVLNLLRLYQVTLNENFKSMAQASFEVFGADVKNSPQSLPQLLYAYSFSLKKPKQIIIAGKKGSSETERMAEEVFSHFIPNKIVLLADGAEGQEMLAEQNPFINSIVMKNGRVTAYVCENFTCDYPVTEIGDLAGLLSAPGDT